MTDDPRPYLPSCMLYPQPMYFAWGGAPAQNFVRTGLRKKKKQGRYPKAAGPSPARLHRGPWQTSRGAKEATVDRRAGTQSRRWLPAKQRGPATQATRVRRSYRRRAAAIPLLVRDTPHGWAAPRAAAQRRGHLALPMDTAGAHEPGGRDNAFPSTCGSGLRGA